MGVTVCTVGLRLSIDNTVLTVPQAWRGLRCQLRRCRWGHSGCHSQHPSRAPPPRPGSPCRPRRWSSGRRMPSAQSPSAPSRHGPLAWKREAGPGRPGCGSIWEEEAGELPSINFRLHPTTYLSHCFSPRPSDILRLFSYFLRTISDAPLLYMRKPPSAFFSTVLMDLREELNVYTL